MDRSRPLGIVLTCMDARLDPLAVFGCGPGELYCVRKAGHVPPSEGVGALAIRLSAGSPLVLILGHMDCAAVKLERRKSREHDAVMRHIACAARSLPPDAPADEVGEANVRFTVKELRTRLKGRVEGAMLDLSTGRVRPLSG